MKVLALLPDFLDKPMGGLGIQFMNMYAHLKDRVDYYICGYPEKPAVKHFKPVVNPFPEFSHPTLSCVYGQLIYYYKALEYGVDFDIIHAYDWSTYYAGVYLSWHFKKPLICSMNLSSKQLNSVDTFFCANVKTIDGFFLNGLMLNVEDLGLRYANKIIHVSDYYANLYPQYKDKSVIVRNGLNISEWKSKRTPNFPGKNKIKVCYIGRACDMKGIDMIIDCNIPENIDFYFIVSHKGAEAKIWKQIVSKVNNKNIFHIKGLYDQDKVDFLNAIDAVVMPSKHEPAGIVAMEALISKNILITTASGGIAETVEGVDFLKCDSSKELEKCLELLTSLKDDALEKYKISGYEKMLKCDWSIYSDQLFNVYKEVIGTSYNPEQSYPLEDIINYLNNPSEDETVEDIIL